MIFLILHFQTIVTQLKNVVIFYFKIISHLSRFYQIYFGTFNAFFVLHHNKAAQQDQPIHCSNEHQNVISYLVIIRALLPTKKKKNSV